MIILDLDDTIFETSSMNPKLFDSAISIVKKYYQNESIELSEEIVGKLWTDPADKVFDKYKTPEEIVQAFYNEICSVDFKELQIKTYEDYPVLREIETTKVLVTTGLTELQNAKINALGIREDFESVHIDDPRLIPRMHKYKIFSNILDHFNLQSEEIWVIGDNPESEIKAAHSLGMKTIQRLTKSKPVSGLADFRIKTFKELKDILQID